MIVALALTTATSFTLFPTFSLSPGSLKFDVLVNLTVQ